MTFGVDSNFSFAKGKSFTDSYMALPEVILNCVWVTKAVVSIGIMMNRYFGDGIVKPRTINLLIFMSELVATGAFGPE